MNKRYGFTLVELLAVILILGILGTLTVSLVSKIINNAVNDAHKESARNYIDAVKQTIITSEIDAAKMKDGIYYINDDGNIVYDSKEYQVDVKGQKAKGYVRIKSNDVLDACLSFGDKKYNYDGITKKVTNTTSICPSSIGNNLVVNGDLSDSNQKNVFGEFIYTTSGSETYLKYGSLSKKTEFSEYIPVDSNRTYKEEITMKSNSTTPTYFAGLSEYDIDKKIISPRYVLYIPGTTTTLAKDLKDGDTVVYLTNASGWNTNTSNMSYRRGFIFWNYQDSTGYQYAKETYSRNVWSNLYTDASVNKVENTITLTSAWNHGTFPAGTIVSQSDDGYSFNYGILNNQRLTTSWQTYSNTISGVHFNDVSKFRPGTAYIKISFLNNYNNTSGAELYLKNVSFKQID